MSSPTAYAEPADIYSPEDEYNGGVGRTLLFALIAMLTCLYLPFLTSGMDNIRWIVFSLIALAVLPMRMDELSSTFIRGLLILFTLNASLRVFSVLWSPDPIYTGMRSASLLLMLLFIVIIAARAHKNGGETTLAHCVAWWGSILIGVSAIVYFMGWKHLPWNGYPVFRGYHHDRFAGVFGNPNQLGICIAVTFPLLISLWLEKKWRIHLLALAVLAIFLVFQSQSRGALLAVLGGCAGLLLVYQQQARTLIVAGILLLPIVMQFVNTDAYIGRVAGMLSREDVQTSSIEDLADNRMHRWDLGWQSIRKHPMLGQGYGIGGVSDAADPALTEYDRGYPLHNSFLQIWQENGFIGLALFLVLFLSLYIRIFTRSVAGSSANRHVLAGCMGVLIAGGISAFFESWLFSVGNLATMPYWICVALIWVVTADGAEPEEEAYS